jgi:hypothetical protein
MLLNNILKINNIFHKFIKIEYKFAKEIKNKYCMEQGKRIKEATSG